MNTDNNKRFQDTEQKIMDAYGSIAAHKELSKITVSDICKKAQIHRTTFYGHFEDINALRNSVELFQLKKWIEGFLESDGAWNLYDGMYKYVYFYYRNQDIVRFHMKADEVKNKGTLLFQTVITDEYLEKYMNKFNLSNELEAKCHQTFLSSGITGIIYRWVEKGCNESPEEITSAICKIIGRY